jgi:hypothetical protein
VTHCEIVLLKCIRIGVNTGDTEMKRIFSLILFASVSLASATEMSTIGWVEQVAILPYRFELQAKIDTGADNSSIDTVDWQSFYKDGEEWIRFSIRSNDNRKVDIEKPLLRYTRVKRKRAGPVTRPVVQMDFCIGNINIEAPVNLADRANYKYRMLIGRSALKDRFLVDSSRKNTVQVGCIP